MNGGPAALMAVGLLASAALQLGVGGRQQSPDEGVIRAARAAFNDAIGRHDLDAIRSFLADDYRAAVSNGTSRESPQAMVDAFAERFAAFPDATYERVPASVLVSASAPAAWEVGEWVGHWTTPDGPFRTGGRYAADWRRTDAGWRLHAELFVPLWCEGPGC